MMLERAILLKNALHNIASADKDLNKYILSDDEWDCIKDIQEFLQVYNLLIKNV